MLNCTFDLKYNNCVILVSQFPIARIKSSSYHNCAILVTLLVPMISHLWETKHDVIICVKQHVSCHHHLVSCQQNIFYRRMIEGSKLHNCNTWRTNIVMKLKLNSGIYLDFCVLFLLCSLRSSPTGEWVQMRSWHG